MIKLGGGWDEELAHLFADERYLKIREFLKKEYSTHIVYPDMYDLFNCFRFTPIANVKAVILGQDPYHEPGQAHGLCFSVKRGIPLPPSLKNIYKELESDLGIVEPDCGDLTKWAEQGVLLLNTTLTVREHMANSHSKCGWAWFTDSKTHFGQMRKRCVYTVGRQREKQGAANRPKAALDFTVRAPLAPIRIQRIFRVQILFKDKLLFSRAR